MKLRHLTAEERALRGKRARAEVPRASHAVWDPPSDRTDPVGLLEQQASMRIPELLPIRYGRMVASPFSYFRGAALSMAADLASTESSGLKAQLCGDAHLSNFGLFGSPERHLFFDVNDFDETLRGPWEWDVKRLAASLEVAGRDHEFDERERREVVGRAVRSYREAMRKFSGMSMLEVWYSRMDTSDLLPRFQSLLDRNRTPSVWRAIHKARAHDSHHAFDRLCQQLDGEPRIVDDPPVIVPVENLLAGVDKELALEAMRAFLISYHRTLPDDRRRLLAQYRVADAARKVVGVGSVGTDVWIVLLFDGHGSPLFLQIKEAQVSVLERFTSKSNYANQGRRVVAGQHLMQAASDIFLGWESARGRFEWRSSEREYYVRQLRDWKGSADIAAMTVAGMRLWGEMCGWTLARAHARSGDRIAIGSYLGKSKEFDNALVDFSIAYADQNERDYRLLQEAVASGRVVADAGV